MEEPIKLDYTLKTPLERKALVEKIIANAPSTQLTDRYLEILSDYILDGIPKEQKRGFGTIRRGRLYARII